MAETPESLVYRGAEGTGAAQVFGREGNPLQAFRVRQANDTQQEAIKEAKRAQAKQVRDKKMMDLIMIDPEKTFEPFNKQVIDAAEGHRNRIVQYFDRAGNPDDPKFLAWAKKGWNDVNDNARRGLYIQDQIKQTMEQIKASPYLNANHYYPKIFDQYMDENGKGKPLDQIDIAKIQNIFVEDPSGFDGQKYTKDFMGSLKDNVFNWKKDRAIANGTESDDIEVKIKGALYTPDETTSSGVKEDANGRPIINATPDFVNAFMSNENAGRYIEGVAKRTGKTNKQVIEELVSPQGGFQRDIDTKRYNTSQWYNSYMNSARGGISPEDMPDATYRLDNLVASVNAFYNPDGTRRSEPTPEAKVALGYLKKNVKMAGGDVTDAFYVAGNNLPGNSEINGLTVENSPNDRMVFSVKYGNRLPKAVAVNLNDEGALAEVNSLYETAKTEGGKHFGVDPLLAMRGMKPSDLFKNRQGLTEANEAAKATENETITKWESGKGSDDLVGRMHEGKRIKSAYLNERPTGMFGWGAGKKIGYDVEYEDGSTGEIPMADLRKVYKGESKSVILTPQSQEEYDKLAPGAEYIDPQGKTRRKPKK